MQKLFITLTLLLAFIPLTAFAAPYCNYGEVVTLGSASLDGDDLMDWYDLSGATTGGQEVPEGFYAFHAAEAYCRIIYGQEALHVVTGPSALINGNYHRSQGVQFRCITCEQTMLQGKVHSKAAINIVDES